ncbi:hypothetical protein ACQ4PT_066639 [Festuca glaucescens]
MAAAGDAAHAPPSAEAQLLVESFCAVTSATPAEASFFLEGHNCALESAVRSFYDSSEVDADGPDPAPPPPAADDEDEDYSRDKDEDDDEWAPPPELYTGGEKSGMVVRDRSKRKNVGEEIFKQAQRKGAKLVPAPACRQSSSSRSFPGTSRLLTGEAVQPDAPQPPEEIVHNIYFWSNGFTVDDGHSEVLMTQNMRPF